MSQSMRLVRMHEWFCFMYWRSYTAYAISTRKKRLKIRKIWDTSPHLFNARAHRDALTMAAFYNQEVDHRVHLSPQEAYWILHPQHDTEHTPPPHVFTDPPQ